MTSRRTPPTVIRPTRDRIPGTDCAGAEAERRSADQTAHFCQTGGAVWSRGCRAVARVRTSHAGLERHDTRQSASRPEAGPGPEPSDGVREVVLEGRKEEKQTSLRSVRETGGIPDRTNSIQPTKTVLCASPAHRQRLRRFQHRYKTKVMTQVTNQSSKFRPQEQSRKTE